jgi:hypothetical protein
VGRAALLLFVLIGGLCARPVATMGDPLVDRADALREELARRQMLVGQDPELGSARFGSWLKQYWYGVFEDGLERCGLKGVTDTPDRVARHTISTFAVSFRARGNNPCAGLGDKAACQALRSNCITLGTAIFCDYDYLLLLRQLARASFAYAHLALTHRGEGHLGRTVFLPFSPDVLVDMAGWEMAAKPPVGGEAPARLPPSVRGAVGYAQQHSSVVAEVAEFAVVGAVVGHEVAHVESNACPLDHSFTDAEHETRRKQAATLGIRIYSREAARTVARQYVNMTCHRTLSAAELAADLRGVEVAATSLYWQHLLRQAGYADAERRDPATAELWRLGVGVAVIALAQALEYQLIIASEPAAAAARVRGEPQSLSNRLTFAHYRSLAAETARREHAAGGLTRGRRHMDPAYRAGLLLEAVGLGRLYEQRRALGFGIGFPVRLFGYLHGRLEALQVLGCSSGQGSAARQAWEFLRGISGTRDDEYLVD